MKRLLLTTAICLIASAPAWANPIQIGNKGSAAQVYGDGSAASASHASASVGNVTSKGGSAKVTVNITNPAGGSGAANAPANTGNSGSNGSGTPAGSGHTAPHHSGAGHGYAYASTPSIPVASAIAPNVQSFNSCAGSAVTGAMQTGVFGMSFGSGNKFDRVCWLNESGRPDAAVEYICAVDKTAREALKHTAHPCAEDVPVVAAVALPTTKTEYPFDYCYHRNAGDANQHVECNHAPVVAGVTTVPAGVSDKDRPGFLARLFGKS